MPKLSRRNWNNILIFVVLILMYSLYDWSGSQQTPPAQLGALVPESAQLLSVSVGGARLVKAAEQWQIQPLSTRTVDARLMAQAWQHSQLQPVTLKVGAEWVPVAQASVQLVGQLEPQIWLLYQPAAGFLVQQVGRAQLYQLSAQQAQLLFMLE